MLEADLHANQLTQNFFAEGHSWRTDREPQQIEYQNPLVTFDFPDPGIQRVRGGINLFGTQSIVDGQWQNVQALHTTDFRSFTRLPDALPIKPKTAVGQDVWAPHGFSAGDDDFLVFNSMTQYGGHGIYVAKRTEHGFIPQDEPLVHGEEFRCIDPYPFQDPKDGKWYMFWGSYPGNPVRAQEYDPKSMQFARGSRPVEVLQPTKQVDLIEGTVVTTRYDQQGRILGYDRFVSGPGTFGVDSYSVWWSFGRTPIEPAPLYERPILRGNDRVMNTGHNDIFPDDNGDLWTVYLGYDREELKADPTYRAVAPYYGDPSRDPFEMSRVLLAHPRRLYLDRVHFDEHGIPYVGDNGTPTTSLQKGPVFNHARLAA